ncbi:MAG: pyridoxamine 5'-phosphate oxidase family protein [Anaerolineae bacterium]|nr:pyridoxamine 5'-phosphate oxidase family protein [Anaerolineae bacterium]
MKIESFAEIVEEVIAVAHEQVWCSVGTVDAHNRPHVRLLHPIWSREGDTATGWILTNRHSVKAKHLAHSPYVSLCYDRDIVKPLTVDCHAEWIDDVAEIHRVYAWFKATPPPLGYDPGIIWQSSDDPKLGLLKLTPYRATLGHLGGEWRYWRP